MRSSRAWLRVHLGVGLILLGSYAYFWHSRDWNTASRLILTYAVVDRGTIVLDGLETQTGDIARFRGHYYCDKLPGFSLIATAPYALARLFPGSPAHPLGVPAMAHWPADYWVTLGTSGLLTVLTAILLIQLTRALGGTPGAAAVVGLAYGLSTPAYVYATLAYGHQLSASALFGSMMLLWDEGRGRDRARMTLAGFLAALGPVSELQVGPVSAILGIYLLSQCLGGRRRPDALAYFAIGALIPTLCLLGYNLLAFGSPWEMGYFHHATAIFARVHSKGNPLGLRRPDPSLIVPLLWGQYRGLLFYAPIVFLSLPGWLALLARRKLGLATVSAAIVAAVFVVNLSYPEWTGGWSTGPRLLVPLLPFAMVPVAAILSERSRWGIAALAVAIGLAAAGGVLMLLFQGVGARIIQDIHTPLTDVVLPLWAGASPLPRWWPGERFARNLTSLAAGHLIEGLPATWRWIQLLPLVMFQAAGIGLLAWGLGRTRPVEPARQTRSDLGVDQQQERRGPDEDAEDPEAEPHGVEPDPGP